MVKEGKPNKVDWAGLMWALVEKEILGAPESGSCYYASHLQCLMKFQKPRLFEEMEVEGEAEVEQSEAATMEEAEEGGDVGSEKCGPGLSLGIAEDGEESKKVEKEEEHPILDGKDTGEEHCEELSTEEHCLREDGLNCTLGASSKEEQNEGERREVDSLCKEEEDEGKKVDTLFDDVLATAKFPTLERITSSDFMQVMDTNNSLSFGLDQSNGEFLGLGSDMHGKSMELDMGNSSGSFLFGNESKRPVDEIDDQDNGYPQSLQQKRPRNDQPWEQTPTIAGFDGCIEQLHLTMGRARMDLVEKEQACINVQAQVQCLSGVVQQKDARIQSLEKTTMEEMQKRQIEANRFNHDLRTLSSVLFGCKRALKDTQIAFAEYRKKFPLDSEQPRECNKEDTDDLCDKGLKKPCSEKEKEMRQCVWKMINDENRSWCDKFHKYSTSVSALATRLVGVNEQLKLLKGRMAEAKDHRI
ncbi:uncharacterized protein A4U43_C05F17170 [Asparagus officinalis]|uniref:Uncharacterized protein n=1 Tax=Asparagus officinalis TaxID=4686 RepID=A0A5P1ESF9_ASPOF|nr:uncharacterized protein LOC109843939 [Asparagus officinalis]XP_020268518.1 uncharacterized protein LOC109843939 [Asparagus officinalis]XP_020268519.1 uncharacterized protein LOC109843939 [Asparagus officinalis]XP_020268520.1 uncharacterized protein LOC109843939 [Asparagus officinalis]XP_020268521.1 uncharacterized protein LOC109843939 [Asparagus officinalis]ONK68896.1 uncharacterized protein A4U43_C05F17170 [Asparagus officinalis]